MHEVHVRCLFTVTLFNLPELYLLRRQLSLLLISKNLLRHVILEGDFVPALDTSPAPLFARYYNVAVAVTPVVHLVLVIISLIFFLVLLFILLEYFNGSRCLLAEQSMSNLETR